MRWIEGNSRAKDIIKSLVAVITQGEGADYWTLKHPAAFGEVKEKAILSVKPFAADTEPDQKEFYVMVERPVVSTADDGLGGTIDEYSLTYMELTIGDKLNEAGDGLDENHCGQTARYAWYKDISKVEGIYFGDWLPIRYWMNIDGKTINLVVQGEPSVDVKPYKNFLFSWAYIGAIDSYENSDKDVDGNFCLSVGSDIEPPRSNKFGINTATGVVDMMMAYSRAGAPYQAHMPKFKTDNPYRDKYFIGPSEWTHKYHFDEVSVVHKYDRERGKLRNVLIGDRSAIYNNDELIWKKGTPEEEIYKALQINAPWSMAEESANPLYGVILKKS